jgi:hypothetical protein
MSPSFATMALRVGAGGIAWAVHFAAIYAAAGLACARAMPGLVPWAIGLATVVAVGACLVFLRREWPRREELEAWLAATLSAFALAAIVVQAIPILVLSPCTR